MLRRFLLIFLALFLAAPAQARDSRVNPAPAVELATPALWRIEAKGKPGRLYLFGTAHLLPQGLDWRSKPLVKALDSAGLMVHELSPEETANPALFGALVQAGLYADGTTLDQQIGAPLYARLAEALKTMVPDARLKQMRPWLAAVVLSQKMMTASELDPKQGAEKILAEEAKQRGIKVEGLETMADQVKALTSLEADGATQMLQQSLDEASDAPKYFATLINAWKSGDMARLEAAFLDGIDQYPKAYDALLVQRNRNWLPRLDAYLEQRKPVFVAVGAGHLVGKDGLVALLRAKGYRLTLVQPKEKK